MKEERNNRIVEYICGNEPSKHMDSEKEHEKWEKCKKRTEDTIDIIEGYVDFLIDDISKRER